MPETQSQEKERVTQYERGHKDATDKYGLLLSLCVDAFPGGPSAATLARIGPDNAKLVEDILGELKRFRSLELKKSKAAAPAEAA